MIRLLCILAVAVLMTSCGIKVPEADFADPPRLPVDAAPAPVGFAQVTLDLPKGEKLAATRFGLICRPPYKALPTQAVSSLIDRSDLGQSFTDALESIGYDITGNPDAVFDVGDDLQRTEYQVTAEIAGARVNLCRRGTNLLGVAQFGEGLTGEIGIDVTWRVYDVLRRSTVYKTTTRGYARSADPTFDSGHLIMADAFYMASYNLGARPEFQDLVLKGEAPDTAEPAATAADQRPRKFDPQEIVTLPARALWSDRAGAARLDDLRRAAVTIEAGARGHGSGVLISHQGHILTNDHVVGDARRVRVVSHDKKHKMVAEVMRTHPGRDVALLRLEQVPENLAIPAFPVRTDLPDVGEDVFAIGTPLRRYLQDTLSRGIISAHRHLRQGKEFYLQADIAIYGGNSGGPLFDSSGNLVALAGSGYVQAGGAATNLKLFVPIGQALEHLHIVTKQPQQESQ